MLRTCIRRVDEARVAVGRQRPLDRRDIPLLNDRVQHGAAGGGGCERAEEQKAISPELCAAIFRARSRESSLLSHK